MNPGRPLPSTMHAVLLTGHGGPERLVYREDVPVPEPGPGEVLIRVAAAGINNTDINTRTGWYSRAVQSDTGAGAGAEAGCASAEAGDASWSGAPLHFPRIQGADVCGHIAALGAGVDAARLGQRVIVRNMLRSPLDYAPWACWTLGSECDGGFAQFCLAPARESYAVRCDWSDAELASVPCAWSTAENLLERAAVGAERVLISGASGGVGSAAVQLARRRGAQVIALAAADKAESLRAIGATQVLARDADLLAALGPGSIDAVLDLVGGSQWRAMIDTLRRGGRYAVAGAIAGPLVALDLRTLYLRDLSLIGCTFQEDAVFENLVRYIEAGELRPLVAHCYPLAEIATAQRDFLAKRHTGKLVLLPPPVAG